MVGFNQLYKVDMHKDHTITLVPVDEFQHVRGHFGVVFQSQSNVELKSDCTPPENELNYQKVYKHLQSIQIWVIDLKKETNITKSATD